MIKFEKNSNLKKELIGAVSKGLVGVGIFTQKVAKEEVPFREGLLQTSILYDSDEEKMRLSANTEYAHYVEFGTSRMKAQPYLRPAVYGNVTKIKSILAQIMKREL